MADIPFKPYVPAEVRQADLPMQVVGEISPNPVRHAAGRVLPFIRLQYTGQLQDGETRRQFTQRIGRQNRRFAFTEYTLTDHLTHEPQHMPPFRFRKGECIFKAYELPASVCRKRRQAEFDAEGVHRLVRCGLIACIWPGQERKKHVSGLIS